MHGILFSETRNRRFANCITLSLLFAGSLCAFAPSVQAQDLFVSSDRTIANGMPINGTFDTVTIGRDNNAVNYNGVHADITGGVYNNDLMSYNTSTVNVTGGNFKKNIGTFDKTRLNFGGSAQVIQINANNQTVTNITGGVIGLDSGFVSVGGVSANDKAKVNISGGTILGSLTSNDSSVINITGGDLTNVFPTTTGNSAMNLTGGAIGYINSFGNSSISVGGTAKVIAINAVEFNPITVTGGVITYNLASGAAGATVSISGGTLGDIQGWGSDIDITGGKMSGHILANIGDILTPFYSNSAFRLSGYGLMLSNSLAGTYDDGFGDTVSGVYWDLNGILQNGDPIHARYFDDSGNLSAASNITLITAVPEPGSAAMVLTALLASGTTILIRKSRKEKTR